MSTFLPYPSSLNISGAIQKGVPQKDKRLVSLPIFWVWMKETKNLLRNWAWEGKHLNFTPKYLSRRELRGAGLANLFQSMLLPSLPRPMTSQVKIKDSFGRSGWGLQGIICNIWNRWISSKQTSFPFPNVKSMKYHREQSPICGVLNLRRISSCDRIMVFHSNKINQMKCAFWRYPVNSPPKQTR